MIKVFFAVTIMMMSGYTDCNGPTNSGNSGGQSYNDYNSYDNKPKEQTEFYVSGYVYDAANQQLINSVKVCMTSFNSNCSYTGVDRDNYVIWQGKGNFTLTATHDDYQTYSTTISIIDRSIRHDITLHRK